MMGRCAIIAVNEKWNYYYANGQSGKEGKFLNDNKPTGIIFTRAVNQMEAGYDNGLKETGTWDHRWKSR